MTFWTVLHNCNFIHFHKLAQNRCNRLINQLWFYIPRFELESLLFIYLCCSSMFFDEDGDLAHEFYEETIVTKNGRKKAKLKRIQKNLTPQVGKPVLKRNSSLQFASFISQIHWSLLCVSFQGIIKLDHPCIHVDFPVILWESWLTEATVSPLSCSFPHLQIEAGINIKKCDLLISLILLCGTGEALSTKSLHVICVWLVCSETQGRAPWGMGKKNKTLPVAKDRGLCACQCERVQTQSDTWKISKFVLLQIIFWYESLNSMSLKI